MSAYTWVLRPLIEAWVLEFSNFVRRKIFQKYENLGQVTFLMTSSYFKFVIEIYIFMNKSYSIEIIT